MDIEREQLIKQLFRSTWERKPRQRDTFLVEACGGDKSLESEVKASIDSFNNKVNELLESALECEVGEQEAFLAEACAGDTFLLKEVKELIAAREQIETQNLVREIIHMIKEEDDQIGLNPGDYIGLYRVIRELGRGGMGAVYLAERDDGQFKKRVAIKLIKRGMDTGEILRRFRNERQILANLNHPNIASLTDGGTTRDGLPYFVMEYIEGKRIDDYCDEHRLTIDVRLKLFRTVCSAVQYAHQNLIVHRDIKPSNILVTAEGVPKLLDFGIAKLLGEESGSEQTETVLRRMTPEYASPEQARGGPITTSSDVYSLGVLLYKLLTGHRPYAVKGKTTEEIIREICDQEPERPSVVVGRVEEITAPDGMKMIPILPESVSRARNEQPDRLCKRLAGDLDNILLMALRKEPQRRYSSVEQFSEDIRRHLENLPVIARKDTFGYRASKFVKRYRASLIAAGLIFMTLLGGIAATTWQARIANLQRFEAERQRAEARVQRAKAEAKQAEAERQRVEAEVQRARAEAKQVEAEAQRAEAERQRAEAEAQRARAERRFNDVRNLAHSVIFELHDAIAKLPGSTSARRLLVERAMKYLNSLAKEARDNPSLQRELAESYIKLGDVLGNPKNPNLGDTSRAMESYRKALAISEALPAKDGDSIMARAVSHARIGDIFMKNGDTAGALKSYRKSLVIKEALPAKDRDSVVARRNFAASYDEIGDVLAQMGNKAGAMENYREALKINKGLAAEYKDNVEIRLGLAISYHRIGTILAQMGNKVGAMENYREALRINKELAEKDKDNAEVRHNLAISYGNVGEILKQFGNKEGALENHLEALKINKELAEKDRDNVVARRALAGNHNQIGLILAETGDKEGALKSEREALTICEALVKEGKANTETLFVMSTTLIGIVAVLMERRDVSGALKNCNDARVIFEKMAAQDRDDAYVHSALAIVYEAEGAVYSILASDVLKAQIRELKNLSKLQEYLQEARAWYQRSLDVLRDIRKRGLLSSSDTSKIDELTQKIAKCDAALAQLQKRNN